MKYSFLRVAVMTAIIILVSCSSQEVKSDLEYFGLHGTVKTVTSINYNAYDKFGEGTIQKAKPEYASILISSFDSLGNLLSEKNIAIDKIERKYSTITNEKHQQTKWLCFEDDDDTKMRYGTNYYYDDKGNLMKEIDLHDEETTIYTNTYDNDGRIISQIGGNYKRYWEYDKNELVKYTEKFYDMVTELFYKDGLVYRDNRDLDVYWTYTYDEQKRRLESTLYKHDNIAKKSQNIYSGAESMAPMETIEWDENGAVEHDYKYSYFIVDNDTVTIFQYDKEKLNEIEFYLKDSQGKTEDTYKTESSLLSDYQYNYENGNLVSLRDMKKGKDYKYVDDIVTITEEDDNNVTESKYKRNQQISYINKDKNGNVTFSFVIDGDEDRKTITIIEDGETKTGEEIYENGKVVKFTEPVTGITNELSYNENGCVSEKKCSDGTILTYKYDFDSQGNWVRCIEYKNGKPNKITERSLIYF